MSEEFLFSDPSATVGRQRSGETTPPAGNPWKILIVDDEPEVHSVTRLALGKMMFKERPVELLAAYSGEEARALLSQEPGIAAVLLDVVMETDDAGLDVVRFIRDELQNHALQIILRTGQPGQAPEREVIAAYEINDYKAKTELTAEKLYTATATALRAYQLVDTVEANRRGLQQIIDASASLFRLRSLKVFASGVLTQISGLLGFPHEGVLCVQAPPDGDGAMILAGAGRYEDAIDRSIEDVLPDAVHRQLLEALADRKNVYRDDAMFLTITSPSKRSIGLYLPVPRPFSDHDQQLVEVFCSKIAVGLDNIDLYDHLRRAHFATVVALANLAEFKDDDTGDHVQRVERLVELTTRALRRRGLFKETIDETFENHIGTASILHDIGKVTVPDKVLQKPGRLDDEEWTIMRRHAEMGERLLSEAARDLDPGSYMQLGAVIAASHHERYDGTGYPKGLAGEDIPLAGRIVAVVDVFDALTSERPYKRAWRRDDAIAEIRRNAGTQFDPRVVEAFLEVLETEQN